MTNSNSKLGVSERPSLQIIARGTASRSTTVLDDVRIHRRSIALVARERGIGINVAVDILVEQLSDDGSLQYQRGFRDGRRSVLPPFKPVQSEKVFSLPKAA